MRVAAGGALVLLASIASAPNATEYRDVRASRPDGRTISVDNLDLERDAYRIHLRSGILHLLAPTGGHTFGAVFIGDGGYELTPATAAERRHLRLVTGGSADVLSDRFTRMILLFTDRTSQQLLAHAAVKAGAPDQAATRAYEDYLQRQQSGAIPNLHLRLLADLLNRPSRTDGVFLALVEGQTYAPVLLAVDPLGISNLSSQFASSGGEEVALVSFNAVNGGLWYSSAFSSEAVSGRGKPTRMLADATHYAIDTTLDGGALHGTTTITFTPTVDALRVLPIQIYSKGALVLHMLQMQMREDGVADPNRAFKAMMADFVKTWSGRNPSTGDFQAIVQRHMPKDLDLAGDGRIDYFFNQWVYGTDIPTLSSALQATDIGGGKYRITGTVTQAGVPPEFRTPVPVYVDLGNDRILRLGSLPLTGSMTAKVSVDVSLPQRPRRVIINAMRDVLSR